VLVLSRHTDEVICIGDLIQVRVVEVRGDKVRLGFTAPRDIEIHRKEIYDAIQLERAGQSVEGCGDVPVAGD